MQGNAINNTMNAPVLFHHLKSSILEVLCLLHILFYVTFNLCAFYICYISFHCHSLLLDTMIFMFIIDWTSFSHVALLPLSDPLFFSFHELYLVTVQVFYCTWIANYHWFSISSLLGRLGCVVNNDWVFFCKVQFTLMILMFKRIFSVTH